jgi:hypothetical protein
MRSTFGISAHRPGYDIWYDMHTCMLITDYGGNLFQLVDPIVNRLEALSETAQRTECTVTNMRLVIPNQSRASGRSAMAGSGLNMDVSVDRLPTPAD